jgi:hypothetical protein
MEAYDGGSPNIISLGYTAAGAGPGGWALLYLHRISRIEQREYGDGILTERIRREWPDLLSRVDEAYSARE